MIINAWENVPLDIYESHMALCGVEQLQALDWITKQQMEAYSIESVSILGIAGGNGLLHVDQNKIHRVVGYDINPDYLSTCKARFPELSDCLELIQADLSEADKVVHYTDMVIANLFIEYIGVKRFGVLIEIAAPKYVSCVIQVNTNAGFVSPSPYASDFNAVANLHRDVAPNSLTEQMESIHYTETRRVKYNLPNGKYLLRLDYAQQSSKEQ